MQIYSKAQIRHFYDGLRPQHLDDDSAVEATADQLHVTAEDVRDALKSVPTAPKGIRFDSPPCAGYSRALDNSEVGVIDVEAREVQQC